LSSASALTLAGPGEPCSRGTARTRQEGRLQISRFSEVRLSDEIFEVRSVKAGSADENASVLAIKTAAGFRPVADGQEWSVDGRP